MERQPKLLAMASSSSDQNGLSDRFSSLPDEIVYRIIAFLGANETARLSPVSRRFRQLCSRSAHLYFRADFPCQQRYINFCNYVDKLMRSRYREGVKIDTFRIHWLCMERRLDIGESVVNSWVNIATWCDVRQLEILLHLRLRKWESYSLPESVCGCKTLRVLRLDLQQTGSISTLPRNLDLLEELSLSSVTIGGKCLGDNISVWWTSLKRLNLENVSGITDLNITSSSSLEDFNMSNCLIGTTNSSRSFKIDCSSFRGLTITRCHFPGACHIDITCRSLQDFRVSDSVFQDVLTVNNNVESVGNLKLCGSYFLKPCRLCIACRPSTKHITIRCCKFEDYCHLWTNSSFIENLAISELEIDRKYISVVAENLVSLAIHTTGANSYQCPLAISAPRLQAIKWTGHPADFVYLESFPSLVNAVIHIKPSCRHKSKESSGRCKLFKSATCCFPMLFQSLRRAKSMKINTWPIEIFFMQNDEPIFFDNLRHLVLVADDSLADTFPILTSFLKGLPNLNTLIIECDKSSNGLISCYPNLMNLLGFNPDHFGMSTSGDSRKVKIARIPTAVCTRLAEGHHP